MAWSLFSQSAVSPKSWAVSVLQAGGWPQTTANIQSLIAWAILEGGGGTYNPLNTTQGSGGNFNSVGVKNFSSWDTGVAATVQTITNGDYPNILADLATGTGIGPTPNLGTWSGGGYTTLAGGWNRAGGYLSGATAALPAGTSGSSSGGGSDTVQDIFGSVGTGASDVWKGIASVVPGAGVVGAIEGLTKPFTLAAHAIDWLLIPSHWVRIFAGLGGGILVLGGLWNLSHAGRSASTISEMGVTIPVSAGGSAALPIGIAEVGFGAVLLFVAFHNLPADVNSLPAMLSFLQQKAGQDLKPVAATSGQTTG